MVHSDVKNISLVLRWGDEIVAVCAWIFWMIQDFSFSENKSSELEKTIIKTAKCLIHLHIHPPTYTCRFEIVKIAECLIWVEPVNSNVIQLFLTSGNFLILRYKPFTFFDFPVIFLNTFWCKIIMFLRFRHKVRKTCWRISPVSERVLFTWRQKEKDSKGER